jgi:phospholipid transport system substrate-binding protein
MIALSSLVIGFTSLAQAAPAAAGPTPTLKQKNGDFEKLLRIKTAAGSPEEKKNKDEIKALAASLLDYSELGKKAMAQHWDTLKPAQREEFLNTFREMIERNYVKQVQTNLDYQMVYKEEKVTGDQAKVVSIVKVKTKGKSTDADIIYDLHQVDGKWMVWDVTTDEVSLVRNYKGQFNRIITEQGGFDELMRKMKKKLAEKE